MLPIFILNLQPNLVKTKAGTLAQMVEQRTENPCVPGSIPGGTTTPLKRWGFLFNYIFLKS